MQDQIDYLLSLDPETDLGGLDVLVAALSHYRNGTELLTALGGDKAQATYRESLLVYDAEATVQTLVTPLLFLQGERDYQVTMSDFQLWQSLVTDRDDVTFISYPELAHPFIAIGDLERMAVPNDYADIGFVDEQVITDIVDWINR